MVEILWMEEILHQLEIQWVIIPFGKLRISLGKFNHDLTVVPHWQ